MSTRLRLPLAAVALTWLAGCGGASTTAESGQAERTTSGDERAVTTEAPASMADAEIPNPCDSGAVQLRGGEGEYPNTIGMEEPGGIELHDVGVLDLDHDGELEHVAYVLCMPGGSGTFDSVRAYHFRDGRFVQVAAIEGGDRADGGLDTPRLEGDAIVVGRFSGDEEGLCCPTHVTDETWQLQSGSFVRTARGELRPYTSE